MPLIDIVTMRGMVPRIESHLLPDEAATLAQDCQFDRGSVAPLMQDLSSGVSPVSYTHLTLPTKA